MKLPDFVVVGAQKSGTTSLFLLLSKHPQLYLPARKEVQFFSSAALYFKGIEWYSDEFFSACPEGNLAGEVSPQYMSSTQIAQRVHATLPASKIIAILREPIDRAYSHYRMACRRGQEDRAVNEAFAAAAQVTEQDTDALTTSRYLQFSDYERVLSEYLRLYGRNRMLILFQEDLDKRPMAVMKQVCAFLGVDEVVPHNLSVRAHQSGEVRFKMLSRLAKQDSVARRVLRAFVPRRLRQPLVFWTEMFNIRPVKAEGVSEDLRRAHDDLVRRQSAFLLREFGITPPWPSGAGPRPEDT